MNLFLNLDAQADFVVTTGSTASPQPCVNASTNLNVGVGADGQFFDLFNSSVGTSLFNKDFPLFQVRAISSCFVCFFVSHFLPLPTP